MAHLTVEISAVANRLCAVLPVADNGYVGGYLGRAGTASFIRITATVVVVPQPYILASSVSEVAGIRRLK
jgi:hypothetical protein